MINPARSPFPTLLTKTTSNQTAPGAPVSPPAVLGGGAANLIASDKFLSRMPNFAARLAPITNPKPALNPLQTYTLGRLEASPEPAIGRRALDVLREATGFKALGEDSQTRVLQTFLDQSVELTGERNTSQDFNSLVEFVNGPGLQALSPMQQQLLIATFERASSEGKQSLAKLSQRMVGASPALASTDSSGTTLAVRLASISMQSTSRLPGTTPQAFLDGVLRELADPSVIADPRQQQVASERPAELARVFDELLLNGASTLDGHDLAVPPRASGSIVNFGKVFASGTSASERLFQGSFID